MNWLPLFDESDPMPAQFYSKHLCDSFGKMPPELQAATLTAHADVARELRAGTIDLPTMQIGVDMAAEGADMTVISCRKGCAHCCHLYVTVTEPEAKLLAENIHRADLGRLKAQAGKTLDQFMRLPYGDRKCAFLGRRDECTVYEHRPLVCRSHLVVSKPRHCDSRKGGTVKAYTIHNAEILISATRAVFSSGGMAEMVSEHIKTVDKPE